MNPTSIYVSSLLGAHTLPASADPQKTAVIWANGSYTYSELRRAAIGLAGHFERAGLAPGSRVVSQLRNRGEIMVLYFACAYAGLTYVPVNFRLTSDELKFIIEDCRPKAIFTEAGMPLACDTMPAGDSARSVPIVVLDASQSGTDFDELTSSAPIKRGRETRNHLILYTSGTTGTPKGVTLSHDTVVTFALQQVASYRHLDNEAITLLPGPMSNTAAIHEQSIPTLLVGGTVAIMPSGGWTPQRMFDHIDMWNVTHAIVFPSMMRSMLEHGNGAMKTMKYVMTGGEFCDPSLMSAFENKWPHAELLVAYGSTESGLVTYITKSERLERPESVGRPAPLRIVEVRDGDGAIAPTGEIGHIWASGPGVATGYWNSDHTTKQYFGFNGVDTGDLGWLDSDGYLYLTGRSKDLIISKGQNIYPAEVEKALNSHPAVVESCVLGIPDEEYGELVAAVVVLDPSQNATSEALIEFVASRIAAFKKPRRIRLVESLPRNQTGKVLKAQLAEEFATL